MRRLGEPGLAAHVPEAAAKLERILIEARMAPIAGAFTVAGEGTVEIDGVEVFEALALEGVAWAAC
jgi:hypothetical protein